MMTGIERLRHYAGSSVMLNDIADQIEREHAQTVEDHEKQQQIIRDLQRERDEALRAAAAGRKIASELRTLAGEWDEYGLGWPLMSLAERLEAHGAAAAHSTEVTSKTYTSDELDERNASCDDHTSEPNATLEGEKVTRDDSIAITVLSVVEEMERHCLGVEWMQDSPVARWARELRRACDGVEVPADVETVKTEALDALKWVREHCGIEELRKMARIALKGEGESNAVKTLRNLAGVGHEEAASIASMRESIQARLMPPGMEWPRFEDGEQVKIGDMVEFNTMVAKVCGVFISKHGYVLHGESGENTGSDARFDYPNFGRAKRPKQGPVGADGVPITNGESVYEIGGDGTRLTVVRTPKSGEYQAIVVKLPDGNETTLDPPRLTHTKSETDSWEKLEEDALLDPCDYFNKKLSRECADCTANFFDSCVAQHRADLVRRAKALAERERGE